MMNMPTQAGIILGTAAYMAPEQARGKNVDKRADIWSFAVVLHEMVTGKRVFEGEDLTDTLASVVKSDPDLTQVPRQLRRVLEKCLQKDPKKRLRDIGDLQLLLEQTSVPEVPPRSGNPPKAWIAAGMFALIAVGLAIYTWRHWERPVAGAPVHLTLDIALAEALGNREFGAERPSRTAIAISPDGNIVVFSAHQGTALQLYRRNLNRTEVSAMPGTEGATAPFFSPDGEWVAFWADSTLKKVPLNGGPVAVICDTGAGGGSGANWGPQTTSRSPNSVA